MSIRLAPAKIQQWSDEYMLTIIYNDHNLLFLQD